MLIILGFVVAVEVFRGVERLFFELRIFSCRADVFCVIVAVRFPFVFNFYVNILMMVDVVLLFPPCFR